MNNQILEKAISYIQKKFADEKTGHDWYHIDRVYKMAVYLQSKEGGNLMLVKMAALFHDFTDPKLNSNPIEAKEVMEDWFRVHGLAENEIQNISSIIENVSFSQSRKEQTKLSLESKIVQDADRLDAIGAIGIARCFTYGGSKGRYIYNPENMESTSVQHFYDKLLLIKDRIQTDAAKPIAYTRHEAMVGFLNSLENECNIQF
ncbi:HD domain-containing protein [Listeria sp. FSL L7-1582]|uniref:HD domain-containing protein n=1 Tax=Listeria portnoyi TaxID=2713504 RepID=UPI00164DC88D|nr:HD domain-containing protein [Listeria portnoyi]MBC6310918.1 HD domain-containing protein [Listeria portnoyi]